jgi:hypothetical protein
MATFHRKTKENDHEEADQDRPQEVRQGEGRAEERCPADAKPKKLSAINAAAKVLAGATLAGDRDVANGLRHQRPGHPLDLLPGESLIALDDHVRVQWVEFHQERIAFRLLARDERPAAAEQVEHVLTSGRVLHGPRGEFHWLLGQVDQSAPFTRRMGCLLAVIPHQLQSVVSPESGGRRLVVSRQIRQFSAVRR